MKRFFFGMLTAILLLDVHFVFAQNGNDGNTEVIILHLNDMHAKTDGFAKIKYLADSLRRSNPWVFIVAAGDNFTGNPYVDMVADKGSPMIDLMNKTGFDVSCFGNHEFDLGPAFLEKRTEQAKFPFICANINTGTSGLKQPQAFFLLKAGKLEIPVLGLIEINENGIPDSHPSKVSGMSFKDPIKTAAENTRLKQQYGCLIALSHLGLETDEKLARACPEFDVIIGGHSHSILKKPKFEYGVMIVQAGSYQRFVGKLTLVFQGNHIAGKSDTLIAMESIPGDDKDVQAMITRYDNNPEFERTVGFASGPIDGKQDLGALMTDAIAWASKADMAFQNRGGIRIHSLPEGEIKARDVYRLDPFGNQVMVYKMTGKEISSLILNSYIKEGDIDLVPSGISYTITKGDKMHPPQLKMKDNHGKKLDPDKIYIVALTSYISAAYSFDHKDAGKNLELTTEECLISYLEKKKTVSYKDAERTDLKGRKDKK